MNRSRALLVALSLAAVLGGIVLYVQASRPSTPVGKDESADATANFPTRISRSEVFNARSPAASTPSPRNTSQAYTTLLAAANAGDAQAAFTLYRNAASCRYVPADLPALTQRWNEIEQRAIDAEDRAAEQAAAQRQFDRCASLSPEQRAAWRHWMEVAAALGHARAQLDYISSGAPESVEGGMPRNEAVARYKVALEKYRDEAARYLDIRIAAGDLNALLLASNAYKNSMDTNLFETDPVSSYAYLYAYVHAAGSLAGRAAERLARDGNALGPDQIAQARRLGELILSQCCRH